MLVNAALENAAKKTGIADMTLHEQDARGEGRKSKEQRYRCRSIGS